MNRMGPGWRFVYRDFSADRRSYALILAVMTVSVAALAGLLMLKTAFTHSLNTRTRDLLGGDLVVTARQAIPPPLDRAFLRVPGQRVRMIETLTVARFARMGQVRTILLRAVDTGFPLYGDVHVEPPDAWRRLTTGRSVVLEATLKVQYHLKVGDEVRIGNTRFRIVGFFRRIPGEPEFTGLVAPRAYIGLRHLKATGLIQRGSLYRTRVYFRLPDSSRAERYRRAWQEAFRGKGVRVESVRTYRKRMGRSIDRVMFFLSFLAVGATLLGGIGVVAALRVQVDRRRQTFAILRCLGVGRRTIRRLLIIQVGALAGASAILGCLFGWMMAWFMMMTLASLLPFRVALLFRPVLFLPVFVMTVGLTLLFTFGPYRRLARASPLMVFRETEATQMGIRKRFLGGFLLLWFGGGGWIYLMFGRTVLGLVIALVLGGVCLVFYFIQALFLRVAGYGLKKIKRFEVRHGFLDMVRNPYRTSVFVVAVGLAVFTLVTLFGVERMLVRDLNLSLAKGDPTLVFIDVQPDQIERLKAMIERQRLPVMYAVPLVPMRIVEIKGQAVSERLRSATHRSQRWALRRLYRSTFRDHLTETERLLKGKWVERYSGKGPVPVSIERDLAAMLDVQPGDALVFDIEGVRVNARVANLRVVDWRNVRPNFYIVFPKGVLEEAPQTWMVMTRPGSIRVSALLQQRVADAFPNVTVIDVSLVFEVIEQVLRSLVQGLSILAGALLITGFIVLFALTLLGRLDREYRAAIYRALGAGRRQVRNLYFMVFVSLATLTVGLGVGLGSIARLILGRFVFSTEPILMDGPTFGVALFCWIGVILLGWWVNRGILERPPYQILSFMAG